MGLLDYCCGQTNSFYIYFPLVFPLLSIVFSLIFLNFTIRLMYFLLLISKNILYILYNFFWPFPDLKQCLQFLCCCLVAKPCPVFSDPMDCSLTDSSVSGISQARILEWVAICFSRGSFQPRDRTHISCTGRRILYHRVTRKPTVSLAPQKF